ncbi:hypothetical protein ACH5RR_003809 [Cinchona calisaya]|uniref:Uncharacterized protein n=1 Tax=Cinchona calisaya TaxID=153742 RepID=A0ABD3AW34_9GENT
MSDDTRNARQLPPEFKKCIEAQFNDNKKITIGEENLVIEKRRPYNQMLISIIEPSSLKKNEKNWVQLSNKPEINPCKVWYVLTRNWIEIAKKNKLRVGQIVQVWAVRVDGELCDELLKMEGGTDPVNLFPERSSSKSWLMFPISSGILPLRRDQALKVHVTKIYCYDPLPRRVASDANPVAERYICSPVCNQYSSVGILKASKDSWSVSLVDEAPKVIEKA